MTLIEVLMAIFIMGIGLLALLTLFPVGAVTMTAAMSDARCAEAGFNGRNICYAQGLMFDPVNVTPLYRNGAPGSTPLPPEWNGPSYPVFCDPVGINYIGLSAPYNTLLSTNFPRTTTAYAATPLRWYSLPDDYTYDANGSAANPLTGVERESKYTYAYVFRLPNVRAPAVVDVSVVVYQGRNLQIPNIGENSYAVGTITGTQSFVIFYNGTKPNIKKGGWVLDTTTFLLTDPNAQRYGPVPGTFYRVTDTTDVVINGNVGIQIETQTPLINPSISTIMVLDNVAEVFPVGTGWKQ